MCEINFGVIIPCDDAMELRKEIHDEAVAVTEYGCATLLLDDLWYEYHKHILESILKVTELM